MGWGHEGRIKEESSSKESSSSSSSDALMFPPKYARLVLQTNQYKAAFCDARKFGKAELRTDCTPLHDLAPDAWQEGRPPCIAQKLTNQSIGIKALLLDQKRACSGVGNWVADEVLYQCRMHPDQSYLMANEAAALVQKLQSILDTAVDCLARHVPYPSDWLFAYRWTKKKAGKDSQGRSIAFITSGGRTTAMIASQQKLYKRKRNDTAKHNDDKAKQPSKKRAKKDKDAVAIKKSTKQEMTSDESTNPKRSTGKQSKAKQSSKEKKVVPSKTKARKERGTACTATETPQEKPQRRSPRLVSPSLS